MPGILIVLLLSLNCQRRFKQFMPMADLFNSHAIPVSAFVEAKSSLEPFMFY